MTRFDHIKLDSLAESNNQVLKGLFNTVYEAVNQTFHLLCLFVDRFEVQL